MTHSFSVELAKLYGPEEAILLNGIEFWIKTNSDRPESKHDGRTWMYNSATAWSELYPYWTQKQIRRILDSLETLGVIVKGQFGGADRSCWYSLSDQYVSMFPNGHVHVPKRADARAQTGTSLISTVTDTVANHKPSGSADGQGHAQLIEWWVGEYPKHHGGEAYVFQGGKDGSAVKRLVASGLTPDQIKRIAVAAWQAAGGFNCSHAASLAGFAGRINEIRAELNAAKAPKQQKNGDRTEGLKAKIIEL